MYPRYGENLSKINLYVFFDPNDTNLETQVFGCNMQNSP